VTAPLVVTGAELWSHVAKTPRAAIKKNGRSLNQPPKSCGHEIGIFTEPLLVGIGSSAFFVSTSCRNLRGGGGGGGKSASSIPALIGTIGYSYV
jgi:hypothetical protein